MPFWMKNSLIPLQIAFIDLVGGVHRGPPGLAAFVEAELPN
jgi:uncharacterized membrane protein (UPF0127 family)